MKRIPQFRSSVGKPGSVQLELVEGCNLMCKFCGIWGIRKAPGDYRYMDETTLFNFIQGMRQLDVRPVLSLAMHGEPTLHPNLKGILRTLRANLPGSQIMLTTNGTRFLPGKLRDEVYELFSCGVDSIAMDVYRGLRNRLREQVRKLPSDVNVIDYFEHVKLQGGGASIYGRNKLTRTLILIDDLLENDGRHPSRKVLNHAGNSGLKPATKEPLNKTCTIPFREVSVCWNGDVCVCCMDWKHELVAGNVNKRSLFGIWHGEVFEAVRHVLQAKDRSFAPCSKCDKNSGSRAGLLPKLTQPTQLHRRLLGATDGQEEEEGADQGYAPEAQETAR